MIDAKQLYTFIIAPVLADLDLDSLAARRLVLGTALAESRLTALDQYDKGPPVLGPALGLWQMERATHDDIWTNFLAFQPALRDRVLRQMAPSLKKWDQLVGNLFYGCAMCRIDYRRVKAPLPAADDLAGMARYWKAYYNSQRGSGTEDGFKSKAAIILNPEFD